jgi:7-carboxy-7-deazaguanine synthase
MKVIEIFKSIQGEGTQAGEITTFVRSAGCNMRCAWCDTTYSWDRAGLRDSKIMDIDEIMEEIERLASRFVCLTGGEPLLQPDLQELITAIRMTGRNVSIFTNGSLPIRDYVGVSKWVVDYKLKSSGDKTPFCQENFSSMSSKDDLKFVIDTDEDLDEAVKVIQGNKIKAKVLISPCLDGSMRNAVKIAERIIKEKLNVRYSLQLHTVLWGRLRGV